MNRLAELILNKSFDECTAEELQRISDKYPYFNAGHLLAATKMQSADTAEAKAVIQKAGLHFHPVKLNALINNSGNAVVIQKEITEAVTTQPLAEPVIEKAEELIVPEISSATETEKIPEPEEKIEVLEIQSESLPELQQTINEQPETNFSPSPEQQPDLTKILDEKSVSDELQTATANQDSKPALPADRLQTPNSEIAFEPVLTVAYFASKGL